MARPTKSERLAAVHQTALRQFDTIQSAVMSERELCLQDRRFANIPGAQWEGDFAQPFANRPRLELNIVNRAITRIISDYRNNPITVDFVPKDGSEADELADACDMLYRADEQDSSDEAFDNAFEEAVTGGIGAWRVRNCYEDEYDQDNDRQRIRFEPINDADSCVFWDLNAKRQDKRDARHCFVLTSMGADAYKEEYRDDPASWPKAISGQQFDWYSAANDEVYVAEYYVVEDAPHRILTYRQVDDVEVEYTQEDFDADEALEARLAAVGTVFASERKVRRRKVRKYILSGGGVLEDCGHIAGSEIPVVMVYGKRTVVDGLERATGHIRFAKDAQRLKNMQTSMLADLASRSPARVPIFLPEQVAGQELAWGDAPITNPAFLLVNAMTGPNGEPVPAGPVGETQPPEIPPAMAALIQLADANIQEILGSAQMGEKTEQQLSGKAIELIQTRLDAQTGIYMDNMASAVRRCGEIWLSMAREVYVEPGRRMKGVGASGKTETITLGEKRLDEDTATVKPVIDMARAKFEVSVDVGPASASRRDATVRSLTGMLQMVQDPEVAGILTAMAMMNMEGEGLSETRGWFRKRLISVGAVKPTQAEIEEMTAAQAEAQQPDANALYLQAASMEAEARAIKAQADTALALAKAAQVKAETVETLATVSREDQAAAIDAAQALSRAAQIPQPAGGAMQPSFRGSQ